MADPILTVDRLGKEYPIGGSERHDASLFRDLCGVAGRLLGARSTQPPRRFWALRDASFSVGRGELVGIVGRNGAGKTTLLKVLSRMTTPTDGRFQVRGRVATVLDAKSEFFPDLTARENVFVRGGMLGMGRQLVRGRMGDLADFSGLGKFLDTPVKYYNLGMAVRLSFAMATHLDSEVLLVDEVLSYGDTQYQQQCAERLSHVAETQGRAVLFVSHDVAALRQLCRRAMRLHLGAMVSDGPVEEAVRELQAARGIWEGTTTTGLAGGGGRVPADHRPSLHEPPDAGGG